MVEQTYMQSQLPPTKPPEHQTNRCSCVTDRKTRFDLYQNRSRIMK